MLGPQHIICCCPYSGWLSKPDLEAPLQPHPGDESPRWSHIRLSWRSRLTIPIFRATKGPRHTHLLPAVSCNSEAVSPTSSWVGQLQEAPVVDSSASVCTQSQTVFRAASGREGGALTCDAWLSLRCYWKPGLARCLALLSPSSPTPHCLLC